MSLHEYAHAWTAARLGDHSARQWGRMTLNLKPHVDKFGTLLLPGLLLVLVAAGYLLPVFAYARPMPVNPSSMRNPDRGMRWYALQVAGTGCNSSGYHRVGQKARRCGRHCVRSTDEQIQSWRRHPNMVSPESNF